MNYIVVSRIKCADCATTHDLLSVEIDFTGNAILCANCLNERQDSQLEEQGKILKAEMPNVLDWLERAKKYCEKKQCAICVFSKDKICDGIQTLVKVQP
jgi:hypothetical protein